MHHVVMNMVHHVMMHVMATTFSLHRDRLSAIRSGLRISRGLLGARGSSLRGSGRLLRRIGGSLSALCRGSGLCGRRLGLLRGVLSSASSKQRESQCSPGESHHFRSF
jgi:hypothetical protein